MESGTTNPSRGFSTSNTRKQRCKVLHSCGVSFLTLASKVYNRVEHVQGPLIGSLTSKIAKVGYPILSTMQHQWLSILSYTDDQIIAIETFVETIFPPATHVFNKIDTLVHVSTEALPEKFDKAMDLLPLTIHQKFPILTLASTQFITVLNFCISTITDWSYNEAKEKEIVIDIDMNCSEFSEGPRGPINDDIEDENSSPNMGRMEDRQVLKDGDDEEQMRNNTSCKDILEMENNEEGGNGKEVMQNSCYKDIEEMGKKEDILIKKEEKSVEDPIVELFANGWYS